MFTEHVNDGGVQLYKDGAQVGTTYKVWKLWSRDECTFYHSCREVVRNLRQKFDGYGGYTTREIIGERAIPTMLYLCSDADVNFSWL